MFAKFIDREGLLLVIKCAQICAMRETRMEGKTEILMRDGSLFLVTQTLAECLTKVGEFPLEEMK